MTEDNSALAPRRMLVVDDEEGPRQSLNMIFCDDYDVTIATSGEEAVEFSTEEPFDLVITDIRMRGMSGIDVLREVKKLDKYTEVIVLTAYETLETARQAITLGASEYLKKPFDLDHIQTVVDRCYNNYLFNTQQEAVIRQDVNAAKTNFLEIVSHELNTPMNGILGFIDLLEDTDLDEEQQEFLGTIRDCSKDYFGHVQDIFTYARLSMSDEDVSSSSFNPATMMIKLVNDEKPKDMVEVDADIPADVPQFVSGPEDEIRIALRKLLQNAVKFTTEGRIQLSVAHEPLLDSNVKLRFEIKDTGPGIDADYLASGRIYDAFSQEDFSLKRTHGGLGVGLSLCRTIADRLGGELTIESEQGQGTTCAFSVTVRREET
ncbi:MAG: response regulator [Coraliomargarita sp.]